MSIYRYDDLLFDGAKVRRFFVYHNPCNMSFHIPNVWYK